MGNPLESWAAGISQRKRAEEAPRFPHLVFTGGRGPAPAIGCPGRWGRGRTGSRLGGCGRSSAGCEGSCGPREPPVTAVSFSHVPCHPPQTLCSSSRGAREQPQTTGQCPALHRVPHCQSPPAATGTRGPGNGRGSSVGRDVPALRPRDRRDRQWLPGPERSRTNRCARRAAEAPHLHINAALPARPLPRPGATALQRPFGGDSCGRALSVPGTARGGRAQPSRSGSATARAGPRPLRTHRGAVPATKMAPAGRGDREAFAHAPRNSPKRGLCFAHALHTRGPGARWRRRGGRGGGGAAAVADAAVPGACSP